MKSTFLLLTAALSATSNVFALNVPENVKSFYNSVRAKGSCSNKLGSGFTLSDSESDTDNCKNNISPCRDLPLISYL